MKKPPGKRTKSLCLPSFAHPLHQRAENPCQRFVPRFSLQRQVLTRTEVEEALTALGPTADVRGEKLSLDQFAALSRQLENSDL